MPTHKNSWNDFLSGFDVGESFWYETTKNRYANDMRVINTPISRRPESMESMVFTTQIFTAVPCNVSENVTYLIKITRTE